MDRTRKPRPRVTAPADEIELLEDRTQLIERARGRRRLGASIPAALAGVFLITTLALGASFRAEQPAGAGSGDAPASDATAERAAEPDRTPEAAEPDGTPEAAEPDETPEAAEPDETPKTEPEPKATPELRPEVETISLAVRQDGGKVVVDWGRCDPDGFIAYKVVRSTDSTVGYPKGANDSLVAVVESAASTAVVDGAAPAGRTLWYRVFGVARHEGESFIACRSATREIRTPKPAPTTETLGLALSLREGAPFVDWTACHVDGFDLYKVVRSTDSTVRWPLGENDDLVAVVGRDDSTAFSDGDAPSGTKLWYRVFCVDATDDGYVVRASSAARAIVTPSDDPAPTPEPGPEVATQ